MNVVSLVNVGCIHFEFLSDESVNSFLKISDRILVTNNHGGTR